MIRAFCLMIPCVAMLVSFASGDVIEPDSLTKPDSQSNSDDLELFLKGYFSSWSSGDMLGYRACFHDAAVISSVSDGHISFALGADDFVALQAKEVAERTMTERMVLFTADRDGIAAGAKVEWLLEEGDQTISGIDRFTLIRDAGGNWRIISLLFYSE